MWFMVFLVELSFCVSFHCTETYTSTHLGRRGGSAVRDLSYLEPLVIGEEAETYERVAQEQPVYKLLYQIDERVEWTVGQPRQRGTVLHECLGLEQAQHNLLSTHSLLNWLQTVQEIHLFSLQLALAYIKDPSLHCAYTQTQVVEKPLARHQTDPPDRRGCRAPWKARFVTSECMGSLCDVTTGGSSELCDLVDKPSKLLLKKIDAFFGSCVEYGIFNGRPIGNRMWAELCRNGENNSFIKS